MKRLKYAINVLGKRFLVQCGLTALLLLTYPGHVSAAEFIPLGIPDGFDIFSADGVSADGMVVMGRAFHDLGDGDYGNPEATRWTREIGITPLGHLSGGTSAWLRWISEDGSVIAGRDFIPARDDAPLFRWTAETGMAEIGPHTVSGMSADGSILVGTDTDANAAFRWAVDTGTALLQTDVDASAARRISSDGFTIVGNVKRSSGNNSVPARWTAESGWEELTPYRGDARDVSHDGDVVVGWIRPTSQIPPQAFRWTIDTGIQTIGPLESYGKFVSGDGSVVVGRTDNAFEHFRWTEETGSVPIGFLPGHDRNSVYSVSNDGAVLFGGSWDSSGSPVERDLFYWTVDDGLSALTDVLADHGLQDAISGWTDFGFAGEPSIAASADGRTIVGFGLNPDGFYEGWLADLHEYPEPGVDFDGDGDVDGDDVDALVGEIVAGLDDLAFDLNADGAVNDADLTEWLSDAATENGFNARYLLGDSNLDGTVNATDLNSLALKWQQNVAIWSGGDFTADGVVDSGDLNALALNWRQAIATVSTASAVSQN